ncbi:MAG TPA: hypothetical protein VFQ65_05675 [Kofleriaceae bacterium]|nr:hypothetical protein [Kofleriaceae bacterium]
MALARILISIAFVGAVLFALHRDPLDDGFPLSTYPMFAQPRTTRFTEDYALAVDRHGATRPLPAITSGSSEVLQAAALYEDAVQGGGRRLAPLCTAVARAVADDPALADVTAVRIVEGTHDVLALLADGTRGLEHVRWGCAVVRP